MRKLRWIHLTVALTILVGSAPHTAMSQPYCGMFGYHYQYWDTPDVNGNCPVGHVTLVGESYSDCYGTIYQWGTTGSCDVVHSWWYCGDCYPPEG